MRLVTSATRVARITWQTTDAVGMRIFAASIAYRAVFTVVSFLSTALLVVWLLGLDLADTEGVATLVGELPDDVEQVVIDRALRTTDSSLLGVRVAGFVGLVFSVFGMAGGFASIFDALNRIFGTYRYTRLTVRYGRAMVLAFAAVALAGAAFFVAALGSRTGMAALDLVGLDALAPLADGVVRLTLSFVLVAGAFVLVLRWGSYARPPWGDVLASAFVAGVAWVAMTVALLTFTGLVKPLEAYGALAFTVGLLLYGYATSYLLLLVALFSPMLGSLLPALLGRQHVRYELAGGVSFADPDAAPRRSLLSRLRRT